MSKRIPDNECDAVILERHQWKWYESPTLSAGKARALLIAFKERGLIGNSKVNKHLSKSRVFEVLFKSIESKTDSEPIHVLIAQNIWRETRP